MNDRSIGVVYDLAASRANDGIHIETAGPNFYIVHVKDQQGNSCMITLSRGQAYFMARSLVDHAEKMMALEAEEEEEE